MKNVISLLTGGLLLLLHCDVFATSFNPAHISGIGAGTQITVLDDPGDTNDAYAAVAEWGERYALSSIQGTHSNVRAESYYQYGFTLSGNGDVELQINYTLMAEMLSLNQATVSANARIAIYQYRPAGGLYFPPSIAGTQTSIYPVWADSLLYQVYDALDQPYDYYGEKIGAVDTVTLESQYTWGGTWQYMVELYTSVWGRDTHGIVGVPGQFENPDAWYSAAAYADPTFTVLTPGVTLTPFMIPTGSETQSDGGLDPPEILQPGPIPEPSTMLLLGAGLLGIAGLSRKKFLKK